MPSPGAGPPPSATWTADEWEARRARAAAFLARPEAERGPWVVGPAMVLLYERGRDRARAREATDASAPT